MTASARALLIRFKLPYIHPRQRSSRTYPVQSGAVVPGVESQLQNGGAKAVLTAASSADGGFVFPTLSPGSYTLTVNKQGGDTTVYKGVIIYASRTTNQIRVRFTF